MSDCWFKFIATLTEMARTFINSDEKVEDFIGEIFWACILKPLTKRSSKQ
ncbi:hypothetical protein RhiirA4_490518 [Rhizophagus irregularis]|uniref:Uncharacterized protein n=1 Tax=Rhizophagus irregularis TaxID=588596 RepID=A0A2I1HVR7_9GLOM|nr:hypothetical protein RhiirA4_490518 [Rhizophagus irregularis]